MWCEVAAEEAITLIKKIRTGRSGKLYCAEPEAQIAEQPATLQEFDEVFGHLGKWRIQEVLTELQAQLTQDKDENFGPQTCGKRS